jgi:putative transposase
MVARVGKVKHWRGAFGLAGGAGLVLRITSQAAPFHGASGHKIWVSKRRAEKRSAFRRSERSGILLVCRVIAAIGFPAEPFFTVNLRDPRSDLLVTQIDILCDAVRRVRARTPLPHRRLGWPPRSYALPVDLATRRCRLPRSVARNQNRVCEVLAYRRVTITGDWQRRYWEHTIRDDRDVAAHMDYTHFNPVKHGLVEHPADWPHSSFRGCVDGGLYPDGRRAAVINRKRQARGFEIQAQG